MKYKAIQNHLQKGINLIKETGIYRKEIVLTSVQSKKVKTEDYGKLLNFASSNYFELAYDRDMIFKGTSVLNQFGMGLSSVRFICGTTDFHIELEKTISKFHNKEAAILFANGFSANMALFDTFFDNQDAIILANQSHISLKESSHLTKSKRLFFEQNNKEELRNRLEESKDCRFRIIAVDGVDSVTGKISDINMICDLADEYDCIVYVDESHCAGILGKTGRGASEFANSLDRVDIIGSSFGKAFGGGNGGYLTAKQEIVDVLRQKGRPYLFSNTIPQYTAAGFNLAMSNYDKNNTKSKLIINRLVNILHRDLKSSGINVISDIDAPFVSIQIEDEHNANKIADDLRERGILVSILKHPMTKKGIAVMRIEFVDTHGLLNYLKLRRALKKVFKRIDKLE